MTMPDDHFPPDPLAREEQAKHIAQLVYAEQHSLDNEFYVRALQVMVNTSKAVTLIERALNAVFYIAVIGGLAWLVSQVIDRGFPVTVLKMTLISDHVRAGDPVRVDYVVNRLRTCHATIDWTIVDGDHELHEYGPVIVEAAGPPGSDQYVRSFTTSKNLVAGDGILRVVVAYHCPGNYVQGIWPVVRLLPDLPFTILPPAGHDDAAGPP